MSNFAKNQRDEIIDLFDSYENYNQENFNNILSNIVNHNNNEEAIEACSAIHDEVCYISSVHNYNIKAKMSRHEAILENDIKFKNYIMNALTDITIVYMHISNTELNLENLFNDDDIERIKTLRQH